MTNVLETLLEKRWILKSSDKALYYQCRDSLGEVRRFAVEKMGCQIVENSLLVKIEKIPAKPENYMGIGCFDSVMEYVLLCMMLMFLEDKEPEEQFILSQLTEYIASNIPDGNIDWTLYTQRRQLVKVLRYAAKTGLIRITDGSDDMFMDTVLGEVLYENTGTSKYFMRNFSKDIMAYAKPQDFEESDWFEMNEDRGIVRRHRVYKRLLFSLGMYREEETDEDFEYLKYYGRRLEDDLERIFDCQLHIHRTSAYLILGDGCKMGREFPANNMMSDMLLLCAGLIREQVDKGKIVPLADETIRISEVNFDQMVRTVKEKYGNGFTKSFREMASLEFVKTLKEELCKMNFIRMEKERHEIVIFPIIAKMTGRFPDTFLNKGEV